MAGMRSLGRVYDLVVPSQGPGSTVPGTVIASLQNCSGFSLVAVNNSVSASAGSVTVSAGTTNLTCSTAFNTTNGFTQPAVMYTQPIAGTAVSALGGTASWAKTTTTWGATNTSSFAIGGAGTVTQIDFLCSQLADGYDYLKFAVATPTTGGVSIFGIAYDLTVQRTPANLTPIGN